ncbi:MAG: transposase [Acidimicrobiales bacterium]
MCRGARVDCRGSYADLLSCFPDDAACLDCLDWLRWPNGFSCPRSGAVAAWRYDDGRWFSRAVLTGCRQPLARSSTGPEPRSPSGLRPPGA